MTTNAARGSKPGTAMDGGPAGRDRRGSAMLAHPGPASVAGHPIHPMLIPFPIAFLTGAALTDVCYLRSRQPFWAEASEFLLGAGVGTAAVAAPFGLLDFASLPAARRTPGWIHLAGNLGVVTLSGVNMLLRRRSRSSRVPTVAAALSMVAVGGLVVTGWMGGELVYRLGIGSRPSEASAAVGDTAGLAGDGGVTTSGRSAVPVMAGATARSGEEPMPVSRDIEALAAAPDGSR